MSKSMRYALCLLSTLTLGAPASAWAQAVPRGSTSAPASEPSSSGSSSSGSSSSGSASPSSSGPTEFAPPPPQVRTPPPPSRTPPPDGAKTGSAVRRGDSSSSGDSGSGVARPAGGGSNDATSSSGSNNAVRNPNDPRSRNRDGRQMTGVAAERDFSLLTTSVFRPLPWYSSNLGYISYNPWVYRSGGFYSPYLYNPYGYNPYGYSPYGYSPYGMSGYYDPFYDPWYGGGGYYGGGSSSYNSSSRGSEGETAGSLRLRVKPSQAKVYLDGALIGTVDQFDGLGSHLAAEAGSHQLELRADGYETFKTTVKVEAGKTITARASMKKR